MQGRYKKELESEITVAEAVNHLRQLVERQGSMAEESLLSGIGSTFVLTKGYEHLKVGNQYFTLTEDQKLRKLHRIHQHPVKQVHYVELIPYYK